jgi:hypothetical protein
MPRHFTSRVRCLTIVALFLALFAILATPAAAQTQIRSGDRRGAENNARPEKSGARPQDGGYPLFVPPASYYIGNDASEAVAVADVNGDGKPDLIVASQSCGSCGHGVVSVLLGNGDGTFQPFVQYDPGGYYAAAVAVADLNHDGKPDLVVTNYYGECQSEGCNGTAAVLLGNGDGTFQPAVLYNLPAGNPDAIGVADLNGDGKLDVVVGFWSVGLAVLIGNGDGTLQSPVFYSGFGEVFGLSIADVNHDGKPDVIAAGFTQPSGTVSVLLGKADGTLQPAVTYQSGAQTGWAAAVAIADMNGDGKLDLVVANYANNAAVLLGNGDGSFQPPVLYSSGGLAVSAAVADVDGDGIPDVVVGNFTGNSPGSIGVLLGNGDGTLQPVVSFGPLSAWSLTAADLNGDHRPDVVATTLGGDVFVLMNDTGTHTPTTTAVTSSGNPIQKLVRVTYTATITSQSGTATGSVSFDDNGVNLGTAGLSNNQASVSTIYKAHGPIRGGLHTITATYSGDVTNAPSTGSMIEGVGNQPFPSETALATSGSPSQLGQPVTFTATVSSNYGNETIPDGELVTFYNGAVELGTGTTTGAVATFTTSSLTSRKHTIKAEYAGDNVYKKSIGKVTQVVEK